MKDKFKKIYDKVVFIFNRLINKLKGIDRKWLIIGGVVLVILIIIIIVLCSGNGIFFVSDNDGERFSNEYANLNNKTDSNGNKYITVKIPDDNPIKYVEDDKIINVFKNEKDAVIYFGYAKCNYCRTALSVLIDLSIEKKLDELYYLDIEEQGKKYTDLYNILGDELLDFKNGSKTINAPLVVFVTDGRVASYHKGTVYSHKNEYYDLNESQKNGLKFIYGSGIDDVISSINLKKKYNNTDTGL